MDLEKIVQQSVEVLGFELVEATMSPQRLLRVFIDYPWNLGAEGESPRINVDDCERVSRHLSVVLPVESIDYQRLEVSSPGVDRPLRTLRDYERFLGCDVTVKFRVATPKMGNRRKFEGCLLRRDNVEESSQSQAQSGASATQFLLEFDGDKKGEKLNLLFDLSEVESARLNPTLLFKKR